MKNLLFILPLLIFWEVPRADKIFFLPTANAGADKNVLTIGALVGNPGDTTINSQALLNGSLSSGGSFPITSVTWTKISGPAGAIDTIYKGNTLTAVASRFNKSGTYQYKLTITNSNAETATDTVVMTASKTPPLIIPAAGLGAKAIAGCEYSVKYWGTDDNIYEVQFNGTIKVLGFYGMLGKPAQIAGGQYEGSMVTETGWACIMPHDVYYNEMRWLDRDSTGALFDSVNYCTSYISEHFFLRNGKLYAYETDRFNWFGVVGTPITKPLAIPMPAGKIYSKISVGEAGVIGLATDGTVWVHGVGNKTPVQRTVPRPAIDVWENRKGTFVAIVPDAGQPTTSGMPYVWGLVRFAGNVSGGTSNTPTDYRTIWKITKPIKMITSSDESLFWTDTADHAFAIGWNGQGEVGNGYELVNKADLWSPWYASNWSTGPYVDTAYEVTPAGHTIVYISGGNAFGFYHYFIDESGNIWFNGRGKSFVRGDGKGMADGGNARPNGLDLPTVTLIADVFHPTIDSRAFVLGTINAGVNQSVTGTSVTLTGTSTATTFYTKIGVDWRRISGPNTPTITSPTSNSTTVTGLITGTYLFAHRATDNNGATWADTLQVIVNATTPPVVSILPSPATITEPASSVSLSGSATTSGGATITSWLWFRRSGNTVYNITSPTSQNTTITGLTPGSYVFELDATDSNGNTGTTQVTVNILRYPDKIITRKHAHHHKILAQ